MEGEEGVEGRVPVFRERLSQGGCLRWGEGEEGSVIGGEEGGGEVVGAGDEDPVDIIVRELGAELVILEANRFEQ